MFDICLFDLDQMLIDTADMQGLRESGKNKGGKAYERLVRAAYAEKPNRLIYKPEKLAAIRDAFPEMKLGIFTRSPRSYAAALLSCAYPDFHWDIVVAFEDVKRTKPYGHGIDEAMHAFGVQYLNRVVLVGDGDMDVRAAYHAGCVVVLDKGAWPYKWTSDHWRAIGHMPDAIIGSPDELLDVLRSYETFLPELERLMAGSEGRPPSPRFDRIGKFVPREIGGDTTAFPIYACGRSFSGYESLQWRRKWHTLTHSIHDQKEADTFPEEWISAVRTFISSHYAAMKAFGGDLRIAVVPHRPGRKPRLEKFLGQLKASYEKRPGKIKLHFHPTLLAFKAGVRSNSGDKLTPLERFANVRDHLYVLEPAVAAKGGSFLVIDDVSTTGSTLIYAKQYIEAVGGANVTCLTIALNVSNVLYD